MKKILLKTTVFLLLATVLSCSTESDLELNNDAGAPERQNRSSEWDGIIGQDMGGGVYDITADEEVLLADLQDVIDKEDPHTTVVLETLKIEPRTALNDPGNTGFILIASDTRGVSIGVILIRNTFGSFKLDEGFDTPKTTSCRGCASGCNLEYLYIDGKKVAICNENGCVADCTKTETELN